MNISLRLLLDVQRDVTRLYSGAKYKWGARSLLLTITLDDLKDDSHFNLCKSSRSFSLSFLAAGESLSAIPQHGQKAPS